MSCAQEYAPQLRSRGFRMTPQRMAILHVLHHADSHLSPTQIYEQARREFPRLTEPTVYRNLEFLARNGLAYPTVAGNGRLRYQIAGTDHHHLACRMCGGEVEVEHSLLENLYRKLESISGFNRINSHMTFFGVCPNCQTA
jgi:Fe2+ or Zn2+ uptake regulation protein